MNQVLKFTRLVVSGAVIGLFIARATGLVGVEVDSAVESLGAAGGAIVVSLAKVAHLI